MAQHVLPPLDALRCFVEAARLLNFRAAARGVNLTPAALGQRIKQLEEMMSTQLFRRTTRSVVLTESGLALVPYAKRALAAAADCSRAGRGELGPSPIEIVLGTRHELGLSWVVPMLPRLRREAPNVTIHLHFGSGEDLTLRVRTLLIDCAVTSTRLVDPKLDSTDLHTESYTFVGSPKLLDKAPMNTPEDAAQHTLLDASEDLPLYRYWRDAPGGVDSLAYSRILRLGTIAAIKAVALRGDGLAVLPTYYIESELNKGRLMRVMPKVSPQEDHFRLVYRTDDPRRSVFRNLAASMAEVPLT